MRAYNGGSGAFSSVGFRGKASGQGVWPSEAERIFITKGRVLWWKFNVGLYLIFAQIHDKCQVHKKSSPSLQIRDAFKLVGLTSIDRYFLRKRENERSETGAKSLVMGQGAKSLKAEAKCVFINQFILVMKIKCIFLFLLYPLGKQKSEMSTGKKMEMRNIWYSRKQAMK